MAVNKNFVVKNGLEVADTVIYATASSGKVGIGSTLPSTTLEVRGQGIKSPDGLFTGILTATSGFDVGTGGTVFNVDGARGKIGINVPSSLYAVTVAGLGSTAVYIQSGDVDIEGSVSVGGTFEVGTGVTIKSSGITITRSSNVKVGSAVTITNSGLNVTGVITSTDAIVGSAVTLNSSGISVTGGVNVSGTTTANAYTVDGTTVINSSRELQNIVSLDATTTATIEAAISDSPNTFTDLTVTGISTLGTTQISGGIVTSTSGITTYYGDGSFLTGLSTSFVGAIGIQSGGVVIGAATTLNFVGAGNTFLVNGNIIDISIQGGGGGGVGTAIPYPDGSTSPFSYVLDKITVTQDITFDDTTAGVGSAYILVQEPELIIPGGTTVTVGAGKTIVTDLFMLEGRPGWDLDPEFNTMVVTGISTLGVTSATNLEAQQLIVSGVTTSTGGFVGNLTGNVTGTASTATTATRITVVDESVDPSCFVVFVPTATGNQLPKTGTNLTFNSSTGALTATSFVGSLTGNADTATSATTATTATNVTVADESTDTSCNVLFVTGATGNLPPKSGSNLTFNSSTGQLTATSFSGDGTNLTNTGAELSGASGTQRVVLTSLTTGTMTSAATEAALAYNAATNTLSADVFSGSLTGAASQVTLADESSDTTCFPVFATAATGDQEPKTDSSALTYNASTGTLAATNVNSTSDANLKENIETIVGSIDILKDINGVRFVWKDLGTPSVGVIAQEVEQVLPELVSERSDNGTKSVNYNGLVGVLIEAVKELSARVESLENQLNNQ